MSSRFKWASKASYLLKLTVLYALTLALAWYFFQPYHPKLAILDISSTKLASLKSSSIVAPISGQPVRLVIPASAIDIPIDNGYFNSATDEWSLSGYRAQFDTYSSPANNIAGDTFVYGHNNDYVFGSLRHNTPTAGTTAFIYTSNGHIFQYSFSKAYSLGASDTSVLAYSGPPILTVQTCTGSLNEWRTMYVFNLSKVVS